MDCVEACGFHGREFCPLFLAIVPSYPDQCVVVRVHHTDLRIYQNWEPGFPSRVFLAALKNHLGDKSMQWVATSDIGIIAAIAFANPEQYNKKAIGIAGDRKTVAEITATFKQAVDYDHQPAPWFLGSVLTTLVKEVGLMVG